MNVARPVPLASRNSLSTLPVPFPLWEPQMTSEHSAISTVDQTPCFQSLSEDTRLRLGEALRAVTLIRNDVLFHREASIDGCYLVEQGALKVSIEDHTGGETWLAILGAGDLVGELGLIDHRHRSATVSAMTECRLWRLSIRDYETLSSLDATLNQCVVRLVCERLRLTNQQVCDQRMGLEARLAQTMLKLADAFGEPLPDGRVLIRYRIGQSRLAEVAGASRENVNRQIRSWRQVGLCDRINNYYCLSTLPKWKMLRGDNIPTNTG